MKILLLTLLFTGCASSMYTIVSPIEAIRLCGKAGVKNFVAVSGVVECQKRKR